MTPLAVKLIAEIERTGPMPFEAFMQEALYAPDLGYYSRPDALIGKAGDFYTSPHLHPVFGAMLGRQMEEMWASLGRPDEFRVIEAGAGMGYLAKDMLGYLRGREVFSHASYHIVEPYPHFAKRQMEQLSEFPGKVLWHESLSDIPPAQGCVLSNELIDAFPVRLVEMVDELMEVYVDVQGGKFAETLVKARQDVAAYIREFAGALKKGYRTEACLRSRDWLKEASAVISEGFVLTIDYGYPARDYYSDERSRGTLMCYAGHELSEDPYERAGEKDITAHVNFSALKKWGDGLGLGTLGFCPQGTYLVALGIDEVMDELYVGKPDYDAHALKIKGLILPGTMGETHKVMAQYKGQGAPKLRGFALRNHIGRL